MNTFKLILRYLAWVIYCVLTTVIFNVLLNIFSMNNKLTGVILLMVLIVPVAICLWFVSLRKQYSTLDEVSKDFKIVRSVQKPLVIALLVSQFFFHMICVASINTSYSDLVAKYPNSEKFLLESFGAQESTFDVLKVLPKPFTEYILYTGEVMNEIVEVAGEGETTYETADKILSDYYKNYKGFIYSGLISLFWCCFTAAIYTVANRVALYHQSIKEVKENKRNGRKHV